MGIALDIAEDWHASLAALAWQVDLGVTEVIGDAPLNRYDLPESAKPLPRVTAVAAVSVQAAVPVANPVVLAEAAAQGSGSLAALRAALEAFDHCELKKGARNLVFGDGNPNARVMIISEAPSVEEDREGRSCVGAAGGLLDKMFGAIGLSRGNADPALAVYITHALPWRTPQDRVPHLDEIAMMRPFLARHIALVDPGVIVVMGNAPLQAVLNTTGILRARGQWGQAFGKPVLPMVHPSHLLRMPAAKAEAWADLLALQAKLRG
jgi:DNA polymerase